MSVVGSLIFCLDCGNLLDAANGTGAQIECDQCRAHYDRAAFSALKVETSTAEDAFPSALRSRKSTVKTTLRRDELGDGATIKEKCPKCGNEEMQYHTLQLRSADEGATVFYTCPQCNYKFRTNN